MTRPLVRFARPYYFQEEEKALASVMKFGRQGGLRPITNGDKVAEFEDKFSMMTGGMAVAVSSCYAALYLALLIKGIGPNDTVIMPALTHVALPNAVEQLGGKCVFVDSHIDSGNLDPDLIKPVRGARLLSVTHFLGQPAYMKSTESICNQLGMEILEDCALSIGATHTGRHVGLLGMAGCFSFYPCKHITTGEGGMLITKHAEVAEAAKALRSFGYGGDRGGRVEHPGGNFRMTEFQAALGVEQLKRLPTILEKRNHNAALLRDMLKEFQVIGGNYALSVFVPEGNNRDDVKAEMLSRRIETSVYYPRPVPRHPYYYNRYGPMECPVADKICAETITLSVGPHLNGDHMALQAKTFREVLKATKPYVIVSTTGDSNAGRAQVL